MVVVAAVASVMALGPSTVASADDSDDDSYDSYDSDDRDDDSFADVVPGEFLVELTPDGDIAAVAAAVGAVEVPDQLVDGSPVHRLVLDPSVDPALTLDALGNLPGVDEVQPNRVQDGVGGLNLRKGFFGDVEPAIVLTASTSYRASQPALGGRWRPARTDGTGAVVAVLDSGADLAHPHLVARLVPGYDVVDDDTVPAEELDGIDDDGDGAIDEGYGHGTYVAGLVRLVAPAAQIMPIRVLDTDGNGSTWNVMQGIAHAGLRGADVVNMSLGGASSGIVFERFVERVESSGVVLVAAAGNDASEVPTHPAATEGVLGVTAIDGRTAQPASFANRGSWIDVAAPGVDLVSTYPGGRYAVWGGTSAAAPLVAGLAATLVGRSPGAPVSDVTGAITSTADASLVPGLCSYGTVVPSSAVAALP